MDLVTLVTSIASSLGISIATAAWIAQQLVNHRLTKELDKERAQRQRELEEAKSLWQRSLERDKAQWQGEIHREVQEYLGEKSAEREYTLEARKRLYHAIGAFRFQLLVACRDAASRIINHGSDQKYVMTIHSYYGKSTLYRLLRPISIAEIIERQMTYTDFSVDATGIDLLRFKKAVFLSFSDGNPILNHPHADWNNQKEHLFSGTISSLANSLIITDEDAIAKERPMHFHEFEQFIQEPKNLKLFSPLVNILENFSINSKPIFWLRLVCFGSICNEYMGRVGQTIGFEQRQFDVRALLLASQDNYTRANIEEYQKVIHSLNTVSL